MREGFPSSEEFQAPRPAETESEPLLDLGEQEEGQIEKLVNHLPLHRLPRLVKKGILAIATSTQLAHGALAGEISPPTPGIEAAEPRRLSLEWLAGIFADQAWFKYQTDLSPQEKTERGKLAAAFPFIEIEVLPEGAEEWKFSSHLPREGEPQPSTLRLDTKELPRLLLSRATIKRVRLVRTVPIESRDDKRGMINGHFTAEIAQDANGYHLGRLISEEEDGRTATEQVEICPPLDKAGPGSKGMTKFAPDLSVLGYPGIGFGGLMLFQPERPREISPDGVYRAYSNLGEAGEQKISPEAFPIIFQTIARVERACGFAPGALVQTIKIRPYRGEQAWSEGSGVLSFSGDKIGREKMERPGGREDLGLIATHETIHAFARKLGLARDEGIVAVWRAFNRIVSRPHPLDMMEEKFHLNTEAGHIRAEEQGSPDEMITSVMAAALYESDEAWQDWVQETATLYPPEVFLWNFTRTFEEIHKSLATRVEQGDLPKGAPIRETMDRRLAFLRGLIKQATATHGVK